VIVAMMMLLAFVGVAIDLALLHVYQESGKAACSAAALAGANELWNRNGLCPPLKGLRLPPPQGRESIAQQQQRLAREAAIAYARQNRVAGEPVVLHPGDILPQMNSNGCNLLTVRCPFTEARGNPFTRFFGQLFQRGSMDVLIESTAVLDQRVYGVCPTGDVDSRVHMLPLVVEPQSWLSQACSGQVQITVGVDQSQGCETGNGCMLTLAPAFGTSGDGISASTRGVGYANPLNASQIAIGLAAQDLSALGGEFSLRRGFLDLRAAPPSVAALTRVAGGLGRLHTSDVLIVPLGEPTSPTSRRIVGLAAGVIFRAEYNGGQQELTLGLAPTLLTTANAMVAPGEPVNPYIGKLYLAD
jgi:hypothetical protein